MMVRMTRPWIPKLEGRSGPLYIAIADALEDDVREGRVATGTRLPPQRDLATRLGVNLTTVTRAYDEARRRGLLSGRVGHGTWVSAPRPAPAWGALVPDDLVDLTFNVPAEPADLPLEAMLGDALREVGAQPGRMSRLLRYGPAEGAPEDREAAARFLSGRLPVDPGRVVVCCGAQQALLAALAALAGPDQVVLTEAVTYPGFRTLAAMLRVRLHGVAMDGEGLLPDALDEACRRLEPRALFCVPTLQNPTAAVMGEARRAELAEVIRRHGLPVVEDDIYGSLPVDAPPPLATLAPEQVAYVHGFSKQLAPGLRVGYLVAPSHAAAQRVAAQVRATTWMAPPLAVSVATRWIHDGTAGRILAGVRRELEARMALVRETLPAPGLQAPRISPHAWLALPPGWTSGAMVAQLRARGVAVVGTETFAPDAGPAGIRVCVGGPPERETLQRGLKTIAEVLASGPPPPAAVV